MTADNVLCIVIWTVVVFACGFVIGTVRARRKVYLDLTIKKSPAAIGGDYYRGLDREN
jgi:hypothetical protein